MLKFKNITLLSLALLGFGINSVMAAPLLQEGKSQSYRRVLTTPSCELVTANKKEKITPFTRFYVFKDENNTLSVGSDIKGKVEGTIKKDCAVEWNIQTALMFTNPSNRDRALIFKDKEDLQKIIDDENSEKKVQSLNQNLKANKTPKEIIAQEPEEYIDYTKEFYLLPILGFEETMFSDGNYVREINIASISKKSEEPKKEVNKKSLIKTFKAAVVFVIDSSISMDPYINRTKETINKISDSLKKEGLDSFVQFGLVSFRSNTEVTPDLEYTSKVFVKPGDATDSKTFNQKLSSLNQAKVSSVYFNEDSYAGINAALSEIDWTGYGARYIVLITDAGAISGSDKYSSTNLDSKELRLEAKHKGAAIYALHLLTPSGKSNQAQARTQYEDLTYNEQINKSLYYPVDAGDVNDFGEKIDLLSQAISEQVRLATEGEDTLGLDTAQEDNENSQLKEDIKNVGYAMQLAYLGSNMGTKTPDFLKGWIADRDLTKHQIATSTPVVLLTKNELSSLKEITTKVMEAANQGIVSSEDMFNSLKEIAVSMGSDPATINASSGIKLNQGSIGEILEMLPYKSVIQGLDLDSWNSMGPDEQNRIIEDLENKIAYYQKCNDDSDRWIKLNPNEDISEAVYPIPLELLP